MKNLFLFLMLMCTSPLFSQELEAVLYLENNEMAVGKIDLGFRQNQDSVLVFKENDSDKIQKINSRDVGKIRVTFPDGADELFVKRKIYSQNKESGESETDGKEQWMTLMYEGKHISGYHAWTADKRSHNRGLYISLPHKQGVWYFSGVGAAGFYPPIREKRDALKKLKELFKDYDPEFAEKFDTNNFFGEYERNGFKAIDELISEHIKNK